MMLWLMVFVLWCVRLSITGPSAASPAASVILYLMVLLGVLQVIVDAIELVESLRQWA